MNAARKKSHYVLVRLSFDRKVTRGEAFKIARRDMKGEEIRCFYHKWPHDEIEGTVKVSAVSSIYI